MRTPEYLSPTALKAFENDRDDFYLQRLADHRAPREPQTRPMSVGSAFDAYVKSRLYKEFIGDSNPKYEFFNLFNAQVEEHNREWALRAGKHVFEKYQALGAYDALRQELRKAVGDPHFEFDIKATIDEVPLLGKPDIYFMTSEAYRAVWDWKVNGYCSERTKSPMQGYVDLQPGSKIHKKCTLINKGGVQINCANFLEDFNPDWAAQLATYAWLTGEPVGSERVIFGIDQICGPATKMRIAKHRLRISETFQYLLLERYKHCWKCIKNEHIFDELSRDESQARCALLDKQADMNEEFKACVD